MLRRVPALVLIASLSAAAALAQGRMLYASTGVELRISHYTWFSFDQCRSLGLPQITSIRTSAGGKVWAKVEDLPLGSSHSLQGAHCIGKAITSSAVYYLPRPGFEGVETVEYGVRYPAACTACVSQQFTYQVTVSGTAAPARTEPETETTAPAR